MRGALRGRAVPARRHRDDGTQPTGRGPAHRRAVCRADRVFGGFWIVEATDLDTVLKYAADCPAPYFGSVEVRPLTELG
ncbi:YciI family protein [Streptomyces tsukubensis]|uniref:YciI family protein n=1 Tax=Streptomyces tsukubensis TaxID=83656 RepID=UPI00344FD3EB